MQIGSRWRAGTPPHASVPEALHELIAAVDSDDHAGMWTLTWLEGRPICTRDDDVQVLLNLAGEPVLTSLDDASAENTDDDDDWLGL